MAASAKLSADDLELAGFDRLEPHRAAHPGDGILADAHELKRNAVDHVLGGDLEDRVAAHREVHLVGNHDVILGVGVGPVEAHRVCRADEFHPATAKNAVRARVVEVPLELLGNDVDPLGLPALRLRPVDTLAPEGNAKAKEKDRLHEHDHEFQVRGCLGLHAVVVGLGMARATEADERKEEERGPAHKKQQHDPVHEFEHLVHLETMFGCVGGKAQKFVQHISFVGATGRLSPRRIPRKGPRAGRPGGRGK